MRCALFLAVMSTFIAGKLAQTGGSPVQMSNVNKMIDDMKKLISSNAKRKFEAKRSAGMISGAAKPDDVGKINTKMSDDAAKTGSDARSLVVPMVGNSNTMMADTTLSIENPVVQSNMQTPVPTSPPTQTGASMADILYNTLLLEEILRQMQQPAPQNDYWYGGTGRDQATSQTQMNDFTAFAVMNGGVGFMDGII